MLVGLSGGTIAEIHLKKFMVSNENTIIGNTVLYGATLENYFIRQAGERFVKEILAVFQ